MSKEDYFSIRFTRQDSSKEDDKLVFLDQTKLPYEEFYVTTDSYERVAQAIERLEVRGAPLIGISAAYGLVLALKYGSSTDFNEAYQRLASTRPTAVNLFSALNEMKDTYESNLDKGDLYELLLVKAEEIHKRDENYCTKIGLNGLAIFKEKSKVLTHCNTGKLATGGDGTALNVIKTGFENGLVDFVYADETRPLLQGLRLTAYELKKCGIPFAIQTDSSAAQLIKENKVDLIITGADRIALNGDSANKIGTYNLAILANYHKIPFYIAAPSTTIDKQIATGEEIIIEYRNKSELYSIGSDKISPEEFDAFTPAFDVTPSHLITGIITESGVFSFPYNFLR